MSEQFKEIGRLSETEAEVMQTIWELATPVTVAQILAIFEERKGWKTSTLSTILSRLIDKGFLAKEMKGKVNYYKSELTLQDYQKHETQSLLSNLYGGNVKNFVAALVDDDKVSQDDINELKQWFDERAGGK